MTSAEIRQSFLDFFKSKGHTIVPSSSVLPDAPNLLFTNAGMNQFVPIFLGQRAPDVSKWPGAIPGTDTRAADTQKCIRAGGKHNDLEDVGLDTYHHTFFEMLGNWSFGDYFKKEAIEWAWELVVGRWNFPAKRLYATVFCPLAEDWPHTIQEVREWLNRGATMHFGGGGGGGILAPNAPDREAAFHWARYFTSVGLDPSVHILPGSHKDNFWMMGDTGPCGPCSEIHVDLTPQGDTKGSLVNKGDARCIEIWNLVFIQFNANPDGAFSPLPAKHVDTGMGFERVTGIIQNTKNFSDFSRVISNYETDIFRPLFDKVEKMSGKKYASTLPPAGLATMNSQQSTDVAFRVIADHIRTLSFAIADGIQPGNTDRNYVLRRILRRAVRYGRTLGFHEPFFYKLVSVLADTMGHVFPQIRAKQEQVEEIIQHEEEAFNKTLDNGLELFDELVDRVEDAKMKARDLEEKLKRARERIAMLPDARPIKSNRLARLRNEFSSEIGEIVTAPVPRAKVDRGRTGVLFEPSSKLLEAAAPVFELVRNATEGEDTDTAYRALIDRYQAETTAAQHKLLEIADKPTEISGFAAFVLYDTYGFPLDLTELIARERGLAVDVAGFNQLMEEQKARARAAQKKQVIQLSQVETTEATRFVGYDKLETAAKVVEVVGVKDKTAVILDASPLYAEMGGQVGDTGEILLDAVAADASRRTSSASADSRPRLQITNTQKSGNTWLHFLSGEDAPATGDDVVVRVDKPRREAIQRHHTVTHLLHWALHEVVSKDAVQKGSFVGPDKLTFDFSSAALTPQHVADVEKLVNERILENAPVSWTEIPYAEAKSRKDIMQFFGEKYGDKVRVVQIGGKPAALDGYSMELCGGTHTRATGEIGLFRIVAESAIAAGIRRIEGVSGLAAYQRANEELQLIKTLSGKVNSPVSELEKKIESLLAQQRELEKQLKAVRQKQAGETACRLAGKAQTIGSIKAIVENLGAADGDTLQAVADALKGHFQGVVILGGATNGAVALIATVSSDLTKQIQAGKIIQTIAPIVGGKGGGRPDNARGGGKEVSKLDEALTKAKSLL